MLGKWDLGLERDEANWDGDRKANVLETQGQWDSEEF